MTFRLLAPMFAAAVLLAGHAALADEMKPRPGGFWKCRVGSSVKGEFGGEDPVGLSAGVHIPTDCAIRWSDGHGKTYCFASNPSVLEFENDLSVLPKAQAFWAKNSASH